MFRLAALWPLGVCQCAILIVLCGSTRTRTNEKGSACRQKRKFSYECGLPWHSKGRGFGGHDPR
jgi:hypothetical protein